MHIISGKFKSLALTAPKGLSTRPTSSKMREAVFNICQNVIENASILDLFSGSGAIGLEAISRGASQATFVEKDPHALKALKTNIQKLGVTQQTTILPLDVLQALKKLRIPFDLIYIDPPYEAHPKKANDSVFVLKVIHVIDSSRLLKPGGFLFIEEGGPIPPCPLDHLEQIQVREMGKSYLMQYGEAS